MAYNYLQDMPKQGSMDSLIQGYDIGQKYRQNQILQNDNKALADILRGDTNAISRLQSPELIQKAQNHLRELEQRKALQGFYTPATKDQYQANITQNPIAAIMDGGKKPSNLVQKQQPSYQESQAPTMLDMLQTGKIASGNPASYDVEGAGNYLLGQANFEQLGKLTDYRKAIAKDEAEWGTNPTKGINPTTGKADSYITNRNGEVKWLGSGVYEAPKPQSAPVTWSVPNGRQETTYGFDANGKQIVLGVKNLDKPSDESAPEFSPAAIDIAAERYHTDGTLPPMGMGKGGATARSLILNRASELWPSVVGQNQRVDQLANKANSASLANLQKQTTMINSYEYMANKNADIALEMSRKVDRTGVPVFNRWMLAGRNALAGDVDVSKFNTAINGLAGEYAKIVSGSMGNTALSDAARHEAQKILNNAATQEQFEANVRLIQREMKNRTAGLEAQKQELLQSMKGGNGKKDDKPNTNQKEDHAHYLEQRQQLIDAKDIEGANMLTKMYKNKWGIK